MGSEMCIRDRAIAILVQAITKPSLFSFSLFVRTYTSILYGYDSSQSVTTASTLLAREGGRTHDLLRAIELMRATKMRGNFHTKSSNVGSSNATPGGQS